MTFHGCKELSRDGIDSTHDHNGPKFEKSSIRKSHCLLNWLKSLFLEIEVAIGLIRVKKFSFKIH